MYCIFIIVRATCSIKVMLKDSISHGHNKVKKIGDLALSGKKLSKKIENFVRVRVRKSSLNERFSVLTLKLESTS